MVTVNMCRKRTIVFISLVLLSGMVTNSSEGATVWWKETVMEGIWNNPANWWMTVPSSSSTVNLNKSGRITIINANHTGPDAAVGANLYIPDYQEYGTAPCYLNMTGGELNIGNEIILGYGYWSGSYDRGEFNLSGGNVTVGGSFMTGYYDEGTVNMTGGTINIDGTLYIPKESVADANFNLDAGVVGANNISMNANGLLDITEGKLILDSDRTTTVNQYITNGWITAYGGSKTVDVYYDVVTDTTILSVFDPALARYPNPTGYIKITKVESLSWTPGIYAADVNGHDVYFGTSKNNVENASTTTPLGVYMGRQDANSYDVNGLKKDMAYYWRIDEVNDAGPAGSPWKGKVWSFVPLAQLPIPDLVSWWKFDEGNGTDANDSFGSNHGTLNGDPNWVTGKVGFYALDLNGLADYIDVPDDPSLRFSQYDSFSISFWAKPLSDGHVVCKMRASNCSGGIFGYVIFWSGSKSAFSFYVEKSCKGYVVVSTPDNSAPAGSWYHVVAVYDNKAMDIYLNGQPEYSGTFNYNTGSTTPDKNLAIGARSVDSIMDDYFGGAIDDVRIYDRALTDEEIVELYEYEELPDIRVFNPNPDNEETGVEPNIILGWSSGIGVVWHDIYLGTDSNDVNSAIDPNALPGRGRQSANNYDPCGLELGKTYYWRVDAIDSNSLYIEKGNLWWFKVTENILIDDFESYSDTADLKATWNDQSGSGTNSIVSLETQLYREGTNAIGYSYDISTAPYYSEICRTYSTAQDWTKGLARVLTLFFYGDLDNEAEQLYVTIEDDYGTSATATYDGDANNLVQDQQEYWNTWNIELSKFSAGGVDLNNVKKIYIGLGDKSEPQAGSSGIVYIDDIRLYRTLCTVDGRFAPEADFNEDNKVDLLDFAELANAWLSEEGQPQFSLIYNLVRDETIDISDLKILTDNWLWPDEQVLITIDACDIKGDISTMLTGVNMNFDDDSDELWADGKIAGYLIDVNAGVLRYPGGAKTGHYHWQYPQVPKYVDAWNPAVDPNNYTSTSNMDIDEYIAWCNFIGAEPLVGINIQSGLREWGTIPDSINEAVDLVTYCNVTNDYNVVYWYLDNEPYYGHNAGAIDVVEYTDYVKQFGAAMREVDPNIKFVVNWQNELNEPNYWAQWEYLIEEANEYVNVADVHWYWAWGYNSWDLWLSDNPMLVREWCDFCPDDRYIGPSYSDEIAQFYQKIQDVNGQSYDIKLAALEWNIGQVQVDYYSFFQNALMQAEILGQYINSDLYMATIWPLSWDGSLDENFRTILGEDSHEPIPAFYVFRMYANALGQKRLQCSADKANIRPVAVLSQDGDTLWVFLLNKSADGQAVNAVIAISGFSPAGAEAIALTAPDLSSDVGKLQKLKIKINSETGRWESVLPPYSLTMLTLRK